MMAPDAPARFFDLAQGGGAALDMGIYGYWFAQLAIGRPVRIRALSTMTGSGVNDQAVVALAGFGHFDHDDTRRIGSAHAACCRAQRALR